MNFDIQTILKQFTGGSTADVLAGFLGENVPSISKALEIAGPSVIAGLISKSNSADVNSLLEGFLGGLPANMHESSAINSLVERGGNIASSIFGADLGNITNKIASLSGISQKSASGVMNAVSGLSVKGISDKAHEMNITPVGFIGICRSHLDSLTALIPAELSRDLKLNALAEGEVSSSRSGVMSWLLPAVVLIGAIALFSKMVSGGLPGCNTPEKASHKTEHHEEHKEGSHPEHH